MIKVHIAINRDIPEFMLKIKKIRKFEIFIGF